MSFYQQPSQFQWTHQLFRDLFHPDAINIAQQLDLDSDLRDSHQTPLPPPRMDGKPASAPFLLFQEEELAKRLIEQDGKYQRIQGTLQRLQFQNVVLHCISNEIPSSLSSDPLVEDYLDILRGSDRLLRGLRFWVCRTGVVYRDQQFDTFMGDLEDNQKAEREYLHQLANRGILSSFPPSAFVDDEGDDYQRLCTQVMHTVIHPYPFIPLLPTRLELNEMWEGERNERYTPLSSGYLNRFSDGDRIPKCPEGWCHQRHGTHRRAYLDYMKGKREAAEERERQLKTGLRPFGGE